MAVGETLSRKFSLPRTKHAVKIVEIFGFIFFFHDLFL